MVAMEDALFVLIIALVITVPTFMVGGAVINVVYRLASGKFFDFINLPTVLAFGVYLLIWLAFLSQANLDFAITH
jgi:lipoprotein signal peptidase